MAATTSKSGVISRFLNTVRTSLSTSVSSRCPVTVVFGNEACDMDSTVSSLLWAYLMTERRTRAVSKSASSSAPIPGLTYVPVCNIPRNELELRRDILWVLDQVEVTPSELFFADDSLISSLLNPSKTIESADSAVDVSRDPQLVSVHMVDHNRLSIFQEDELAEYISCIVDHHVDEKRYLTGTKVNRDLDTDSIRRISLCGSNVSNIVYLSRTMEDGIFANVFDDPHWKMLVKCTVTVDSQVLYKGDDTDMFALVWSLNWLESDRSDSEYKFSDESLRSKVKKEIEPLYNDILIPKRNDLTGFDMARRLLKDCKFAAVDMHYLETTESKSDGDRSSGVRRVVYGVPGAGLRFSGFCTLFADTMHDTLMDFLDKKNLDFGVLMMVFTDEETGEFSRETCLFAHRKNVDLFELIAKELDKPNELFNYEPIDLDALDVYQSVKKNEDLLLLVWRQWNVKSSRKQLMPVLSDTLLRSKL